MIATDILHVSSPGMLDAVSAGGKAKALATLSLQGFEIPQFIAISTEVFSQVMLKNSLRERILSEIKRKELSEMRWEEMWDASLRIRNMVAKATIPRSTSENIVKALCGFPRKARFAVRSSSSSEDGVQRSFAGIHESFVNVARDDLIEKIKLVWASLWSPSAFVYARELGHDLTCGNMAVVVQQFETGEFSGVMFSRSPVNHQRFAIEAVPGLNQSFVDGKIQPWRWTFDRLSGNLVEHKAPHGIPERNRHAIPEELIITLKEMLFRIEDVFGSPQDVEWTSSGTRIFVLQSRPVTAASRSNLSGRSAFDIGLRRPIENLRQLRERIDASLIPDFNAERQRVACLDLKKLSDTALVLETHRRADKLNEWKKLYWDVFIPFGHGARMFGEFYNDIVKPEDPFEFLALISDASSQAHRRNAALAKIGQYLAKNPKTLSEIKTSKKTPDQIFNNMIEGFKEEFSQGIQIAGDASLKSLAVKYATVSIPQTKAGGSSGSLQRKFFAKIAKDDRSYATELLDLAKTSYAMRDDDNLMVLGLEKSLLQSISEARRRIGSNSSKAGRLKGLVGRMEDILSPSPAKSKNSSAPTASIESKLRHIQMTGQPAGKGLATGRARVINNHGDLNDFMPGEVLVCDSIEPEMNYIIPLAAAIVERRGGMLVHGAIAAREYGIPCVTGIPDANKIISDGDSITVDGYLGIVRVNDSAQADK